MLQVSHVMGTTEASHICHGAACVIGEPPILMLLFHLVLELVHYVAHLDRYLPYPGDVWQVPQGAYRMSMFKCKHNGSLRHVLIYINYSMNAGPEIILI
jgi:hypothetical protein